MTPDELISLAKACEDVISAEHQIDGMAMSPQETIKVLRSSVRTLAVVQRDLIRSILSPGL